MPSQESTDIIRRLNRALTIDTGRAVDDPFILPARLKADVQDDLVELTDDDTKADTAVGGKVGASGKVQRGYSELERQLRGGYRGIGAIDEEAISNEDRRKVYQTYLWPQGEIGRFDDSRIMDMATLAVKIEDENLVQEDWRYSAARVQRIRDQLTIIANQGDEATGGSKEMAVKLRQTAEKQAGTTLLRVRFFYCSATRDADKTPELARLEFQPRRPAGHAHPAKSGKAGANGGATTPSTPATP